MVYVVVFALTLTVSAEVGIAAGVVVSWLFSLALPYTQPVPVQVLKITKSSGHGDYSRAVSSASASMPASPSRPPSVNRRFTPLPPPSSPQQHWIFSDILDVDCDTVGTLEHAVSKLNTIAVVDFKYPLLFANGDKLKVRLFPFERCESMRCSWPGRVCCDCRTA